MRRALLALILSIALYANYGLAQEFPVYNHFYNTPYLYNPAEAGAYPWFNVSLNHRQQWRDIDGAPVVTTFTYEMPFDYKKWRLGASLRNFNRGLLSTNDFLATYAYAVDLTKMATLHFGLSGGLTANSIDVSQIQDLSDPAIANFLNNNIQPLANVGLKMELAEAINIGVALPNIFKTQYVNSVNFESLELSPFNEFTVMAYYKKRVASKIATKRNGKYKRRVKVEDTYSPLQIFALYQYSELVGQRVEVSTTLNLNESFWFGGSYRLNYGISGIVGFNIKKLAFSYAYEPSNRLVSNLVGGSHEIQLKYTIGDKIKVAVERPKLQTLARDQTHAPRFSAEDVQLGGGEEQTQKTKYYVVVKEFRDFNSADKLVKKLKEEEDITADIFYNKENGIFYVYIFETFNKREANKDKDAAEELTKFKNIKIITVDVK